MRYTDVEKQSDANFRMLTGYKRETFKVMLEILREAEAAKKALHGRPAETPMEERLLMACQYWREYRTFLHIGVTYGVSKAKAHRTIVWIEDVLIKSGKFTLPGKKALTKSDVEYEVVLIDATESPIQRPKKNKNDIIRGKRSDTP